MNVLVTGSEGYIGIHMTEVLRSRGHEVTGLDTGFYTNGWLYGDRDADRARTIRRDIRQVEIEDLRGYDAVVHLAELSNDPLGELRPEVTYKINHEGSVRLATFAKAAGVPRFVYASSCSVYGVGPADHATEESPVNPQTAYARCKVLVERDVGELADDDFSPTFLRNATAFGASPRMRFDIVLNNLAGHAWTRREIRLSSDGTPWRPLVHVLDICDAFAATLDAPREVVHDRRYNVGDTAQNYRVAEIAQTVGDAFPDCRVTLCDSGQDNRSYRVDFTRIREELPGFRCRRSAADGARELAAIFAQVGLTLEDFEGRRYTRLLQLKHLLADGRLTEDLNWLEASQPA